MTIYRYTIRWNNSTEIIEVQTEADDLTARELVRREAWKMAVDLGYRPPEWWQFWRWLEASMPQEYRYLLKGPDTT